MRQVLLVEPDPEKNTIFSLNLEMYVGAVIISKERMEQALDVLAVVDNIDLIVCPAQVNGQPCAQNIYYTLRAQGKDMPMVVRGHDDAINSELVDFLPTNCTVKQMVKTVAGIFGVTAKDMVNMLVPDFFPVSVSYFRNLPVAFCDVFIRKKKGPGEYTYEKCFNAEQRIDVASIEGFSKRGMAYLYVEKNKRLKLTNVMTEALVDKLTKADLSQAERLNTNDASMALIREEIFLDGMTPEVIKITRATITSLTHVVKESPEFKALLQNLLENKSSFAYGHCQVITYLATHCIKNIDWGSPEVLEKVGFITFFHDITLQNDQLVRIHSEEQLFKAKLSPEDQTMVRRHALDASELVKAYPKSPIGADQLIRCHHGAPNGIGFPEVVSLSLIPLSVLFMICEDYAHGLFDAPSLARFDKQWYISKLRMKYTRPKQRSILKTLEGLRITG
jgi:hypothetical protein